MCFNYFPTSMCYATPSCTRVPRQADVFHEPGTWNRSPKQVTSLICFQPCTSKYRSCLFSPAQTLAMRLTPPRRLSFFLADLIALNRPPKFSRGTSTMRRLTCGVSGLSCSRCWRANRPSGAPTRYYPELNSVLLMLSLIHI